MNLRSILKSGAVAASLLFCVNVKAQEPVAYTIKTGPWLGKLKLNDSTELPFNFEVQQSGNYRLKIRNAKEEIYTEFAGMGATIIMKMPVFDSYLEFVQRGDGDVMTGNWVNNARKEKNIIPFNAAYGEQNRFGKVPTKPLQKSERYLVTFNPGTKDEYKALGLFETNSGMCTGTFATESGDYRYLEGYNAFGEFKVSCFDGSHAFLFTADKRGDSLVNGHFYSGLHSHETFVAVLDDKFELPDPDSLTWMKPGYKTVDFNFRNLEGKPVTLRDARYKGKVVIIQLMGTWCPNCMDETAFLAPFYDKYKAKGLEVVGLAFERTDDFGKAVSNLERTKKRFNVNYELLVTMKTGSAQASEALPMLNKVMAFPTTIYIDKKGIVRKVYTGFYGPATGKYYDDYVEKTRAFVEKLLNE